MKKKKAANEKTNKKIVTQKEPEISSETETSRQNKEKQQDLPSPSSLENKEENRSLTLTTVFLTEM